MPSQTNVGSFVLRFVHETTDIPTAPAQGDWHGLIRHVQTDHEERFTRLADLFTFISRYVDLTSLDVIGSAVGRDAAEMTETGTAE